jgi:competence protein ComEC
MTIRRERLLLLILVAAVIAVWWAAWGEISGGLVIAVLDVGQGDSILVQAPSGRTMLIDGGGQPGQEASGYDVGREVVVPALLARRVKKIDVMVITHPHEDHIGGLGAVVEAVPVKMVLDPELNYKSQIYQHLLEEIRKRKIPRRRATEGQRLNLGDGIHVEVLNPPDPRLTDTADDVNNNSVVMRLTDGSMTALFAADIDQTGAERLARLGESIRSTVLKVPHHGSAGAAVPRLLEAVRPQLAVISVGANNQFGHPSEEMLRELRRVGAKVMRTDRDGAVTVKLRPPRWWAWGYGHRRRGETISGQETAADKQR